MSNQTRSQKFMAQAIDNIKGVSTSTKELKDIYGGMCHKFPVLVRTCGLCQAIAFIESKSSSSDKTRKAAHEMLTSHIKSVLTSNGFVVNGTPGDTIARLDMREYTRATRILLDAWIYYKRFAESILGVVPGDEEKRK